jgi:hypothetical protein
LEWPISPVEEMHTPLMWGPLPAFDYVPRYSAILPCRFRGNVFDNVVVVKARMHETQILSLNLWWVSQVEDSGMNPNGQNDSGYTLSAWPQRL